MPWQPWPAQHHCSGENAVQLLRQELSDLLTASAGHRRCTLTIRKAVWLSEKDDRWLSQDDDTGLRVLQNRLLCLYQ